MSRIDQLIQELCPEGVEYRALGELLETIPRGKRLTKAELPEGGSIPVFHGGLEPFGFTDQANTPAMTVMVINVGASAGNVGWSDEPFWCSDGCFALPHVSSILPKYLYYCASANQQFFVDKVRKAGIPTLAAASVLALRIPFPPLEVQREIVSILDKFTQLEAELEAELEARRLQFQHLVDSIFDLHANSIAGEQISTLVDQGSFSKGGGLQKSDFIEEGMPCLHYGQIHTTFQTVVEKAVSHITSDLYSKLKKATYGNLVLADTAEDVEGVARGIAWVGDHEVAVGGHTLVYDHRFDPLFIAYFLKSHAFQQQKNSLAKGVKVKDISSSALGRIAVPVPQLAAQREAGLALQKLEMIVSDISFGLPAEIAARRKQYEYYRNKLLTFKELESA